MPLTDQTREELRALVTRYPDARSALLPMLHLVQSEEDCVTPEGIAACAEVLGLSTAEVAGVATFYTMYKRRPVGRHHVGVCTNTMCAVLGGDAVWDAVSQRLGIGHEESTADGGFSLERIECQAACTHAPVMTVDWEFLDDQTPASAVDVIDALERGEPVVATRGPQLRDFQATERTLAFPDDGLVGEGGQADEKMLAGLMVARERGMTAPGAGQEA
jgi:NADH-quinone oxidoreductase subunit E